jgi:cysteine desulfurase/selenocysteine lyase
MFDLHKIRENILGIDKKFPIYDGSEKQYVFLDNGASTPSFKSTFEVVQNLLENYSAVHRGHGYKSMISTEAYEESYDIIKSFVGAGEDRCCVFVKNTTEAINKLSLKFQADDIVITTEMEHHSNFLPWRRHGNWEFANVDEDGMLDMEDLISKIKKHAGKLKLVALTGASNVSGVVTDYHLIAKIAHENGAMFLLDAAQLSPHRKIDMLDQSDDRHIDFLVMSGHKLYAPYGTGVLISPKGFLNCKDPEYVGGGMAKAVSPTEVFWHGTPDREEAGSPNVIGAVAFAASCKVLSEIGMENVAQHEIEIANHTFKKLEQIKNLRLLVKPDYSQIHNRLAVFTFVIENQNYIKAATALNYEYAIGVRSGSFCTQPYISRLLKLDSEARLEYFNNLKEDHREKIPGAIRASVGIYNSIEEMDYFIEAISNIANGEYKLNYKVDGCKYIPENVKFETKSYFKI